MERFKSLIERYRHTGPIKDREKNVFSLGARGYYEDPKSDLLAFFLDSAEDHRFGNVFLKALFECYNAKKPVVPFDKDPTNTTRPVREESTVDNKRPDIIVEGLDWVLVIENKVYAQRDNPFDLYEAHVASKYPKRKRFLVVLDTKDQTIHRGWVQILYSDFIKALEENLSSDYPAAVGCSK